MTMTRGLPEIDDSSANDRQQRLLRRLDEGIGLDQRVAGVMRDPTIVSFTGWG